MLNIVSIHSLSKCLIGIFALALIICTGCGGEPVAAAADPDQARETLNAVLNSWKEGGTPEQWQEKSPQVIVQDFDWAAGAKLKDFELVGSGELRDANLICKVNLTIEKGKAKPAKRTVTYIVGTDPVLTVFRDALQ